MKIRSVDKVRVYVRLLRSNEINKINNYDELGENTLCLRVDYAINVHEGDENEFNDYANYVKNKDDDHVGDGC